ncbi:MAG TPA: DEAD/DEAH box helicase [Anaerolineales bacterium]|nr:DEAD/DEAH box helicase [Anaerolineales bacterium]
MQPEPTPTFATLGLNPALVEAITALGYETPTPIQQQTIPYLLEGRDVLGQAQTGTGKTAAFALPILHQLNLEQFAVQALVLTPTRELAIQVAEAIHSYAKFLGKVRVAPIYGGDSMGKQINRLQGGLHVVVGTPGRVMDHLRRGTLKFDALRMVALDEADEMLRMGFQEDVEWILEQAQGEQQIALFSATMPREIRRIAERYLKNPAFVEIKHKTLTVPTVEQVFMQISDKNKLDTLTHVLETMSSENSATLIFVRTKVGAAELVERLDARGYAVDALHGDMNQQQRESVIRRMKDGQIEILVATDVAARGLDVEHISGVINYDIPNDPESYVHRIGRTARAGRAGKAILFVTPREMRMMREIEHYTGKKLAPAKLPTLADVAARRRAIFKERILSTLEKEDLSLYVELLEELMAESEQDALSLAAAAAWLARGSKPLERVVDEEELPAPTPYGKPLPPAEFDENALERFGDTTFLYVDIGRRAGIRPGDIVGAIANESGLPGKFIGPIHIADDYTLVGVPSAAVTVVLSRLSRSSVRGKAVSLRLAQADELGGRGASAALRSGKSAPHSGKAEFRTSKGGGRPAKAAARPSGKSPHPAVLRKSKKEKKGR